MPLFTLLFTLHTALYTPLHAALFCHRAAASTLVMSFLSLSCFNLFTGSSFLTASSPFSSRPARALGPASVSGRVDSEQMSSAPDPGMEFGFYRKRKDNPLSFKQTLLCAPWRAGHENGGKEASRLDVAAV